MLGSRIFVGGVFLLLAAAFVYPTVVIYAEFGFQLGHALAALYSHTFLYFTFFGVVALAALYRPAVVFVDFYWHHVRYGKPRFVAGWAIVALLSVVISDLVFGLGILPPSLLPASVAEQGPRVPAIFELNPQTLTADAIEASACATRQTDQKLNTAAVAVCRLQQISRLPVGFSTFVRSCPVQLVDDLLEPSTAQTEKRYCFPIGAKADAATCCAARPAFQSELAALYAGERTHSRTVAAHVLTLPAKVFFMLVVLVIGVMLAFWRDEIYDQYSFCIKPLEHGVLIGAAAVLFWPIANQSFLQAASALFGGAGGGAYQTLLGPAFSVVFGLWALLILYFFFRHIEQDVTQLVRMFGGLASVVAVIKYDRIIDYAVLIMGPGAGFWTYPALMLAGFLMFGASLLFLRRRPGKPWRSRRARESRGELAGDTLVKAIEASEH